MPQRSHQRGEERCVRVCVCVYTHHVQSPVCGRSKQLITCCLERQKTALIYGCSTEVQGCVLFPVSNHKRCKLVMEANYLKKKSNVCSVGCRRPPADLCPPQQQQQHGSDVKTQQSATKSGKWSQTLVVFIPLFRSPELFLRSRHRALTG